MSNKFSNAVFFANSREFQVGSVQEQEMAAACNVLIQNAIVVWNYLYLSQVLVDTQDQSVRTETMMSVERGSVIAWRHINLHGEYDFTQKPANDAAFDFEEILALQIS